ncbi:MAG TPA: hypothetical protein VM734_02460 [Kofleriaceae bacterium]|nr:hypothetical protein [Kofleriaceae bacterium]
MRSTTVIVVDVDAPEVLQDLSGEKRRRTSLGWQQLVRHSAEHPDAYFMRALSLDLGVVEHDLVADGDHVLHRCVIDRGNIEEVLGVLECALADPETLCERLAAASPSESPAHVIAALRAGEASPGAGPAEEAAAFATNLVESVRMAKRYWTAVCWEHRDPRPV